ncbi:MAG: TonB-dependent receptor [Bacteroidales bacterium]|nr:TonB-dependent receptor [Bacteroidales bacterium]
MKRILWLFSLLLITGSVVMAQTVQISGTVTGSEDGLPLPGVNITVKGTTVGAISGADGKYTLSAPASAQSLVFSFIGFVTQEAAIQGRTRIDIVLKQDLFNVDEVVVVAYGTQQKRDIAGSIASVKGDAIKSIPVQSFDQSLQGKASGVSITLPNGVLNNPPVIRVRGYNSITGSSSPLIVVDGVPIFTGDVSSNSSASNTLADINPADIASLEILKDASATAVYGSRAANGVILITTKRGAASEKPKITYDFYMGWSKPYKLFEVMNAAQYVEHKNLARKNYNDIRLLNAPPNNTPLNGGAMFFLSTDADGNTIDTKWSDYIYKTGFQQNHALSISGATRSTNYYLSVGYTDQAGIIVKNQFTRKNVRLNLDQKVTDYFNLSANFGYTNSLNAAPNTGSLPGQAFNTSGIARLAFVTSPIVGPYNIAVAPNVYNDGQLNLNGNNLGTWGNPGGSVGYLNPIPVIDNNKFTSEGERLLFTFSATLTPIKGLSLKTVYGIDNIGTESISFQSPVQGDGYSSNGTASNTFNRRNRWTWTNTANYLTTFVNKFNLNLLIGAEEQYTTINGWGGNRSQVADPFFTTYQGSWVTPLNPGGLTQTENYFISYFTRVNFNYSKKYYLEISGRRDGFSGLAPGKKFGTFGGVSLMWALSEENFIKSTIGEYVSDLRLKASYGRVGNISGIDNFGSLFLYSAGVYSLVPTLFFSQAGNADLKWESSDKYDFGLSFGILRDRIQVDMSYFYNDINNLILNTPQAPSKGIPGNSIPQNVGSMFNKGFELSLTSYNISKKNLQWTTTLNLSTLKNEVTSLAPGLDFITGYSGGTTETTNRTMVGYPIGMIFGVRTNGVDPDNGSRIFLDKDGREVLYSFTVPVGQSNWTYRDDGTTAPAIGIATDGKPLGSPIPKVYGGLENILNYNGFDFNLGLTYAFDFYNYFGSKAGLRDQRFWNNSVEVYEEAWKKAGDITDIPKPIFGDNLSNGSTMVASQNVERGDYVKVRNISLGYTFKKLPSQLGIQSIRLYTQAFNAFIFTKYSGSDPEVSTNGDTNLSPGIDRNTAPQARTFTFGINVNF